ncbi:DUF4097 family beta strand repeat-containing protein [Bulleidia sp. zg-1006]|uniref:DUF4097 family beta strand repeat-containing protein n=1 Tax=Bulleidia sp. zg-1006 TaxID=2806552 RepID=UPI00193A3BC0|nr:DUF4097 family beta strand repeat-containing protein [Bulleidia sp. zg-1006]QRG86670.1 DUF4097 family beta strand repeat protein [Bulleidia sp. zg-1006]
MTKQEYLHALKDYLNDYPNEDQAEILQSFENHIDESLAQGKTMDEIVKELGNIEDMFLDQPQTKKTGFSDFVKTAIEKTTPFLKDMNFRWLSDEEICFEETDSFPCSKATEIFISGDYFDVDVEEGESVSYSYKAYTSKHSKKQAVFTKNLNGDVVHFNSKHGHGTLLITLPSSIHHLNIQTQSGNINLSNLKVDELQLNSKASDIILDDLRYQNAYFHLAAGDVELNDCIMGKTSIETLAGDIDVNSCSGDLALSALAGAVDINHSQGSFLKINTKAGDVDVSGDYPKADIRCTAGDIDLELFRIENYEIKSSTGDIQVNCSQHDFETRAESQMGDMNIAHYQGNGRLYIKSTTGDIDVK